MKGEVGLRYCVEVRIARIEIYGWILELIASCFFFFFFFSLLSHYIVNHKGWIYEILIYYLDTNKDKVLFLLHRRATPRRSMSFYLCLSSSNANFDCSFMYINLCLRIESLESLDPSKISQE